LAVAGLAPLTGRSADSVDGVTLTNGTVYSLQGDRQEILTDNLKLPFKVEVSTNGSFTVANGKIRMLQEGQTIRSDGWLLSADGNVEPVFDHVTVKEGKVLIVRDGQAEPLAKAMTFPNNLNISPDLSCVYPNGANAHTRLMDGQIFKMDGTPIPAKDTISFKNGRVVVLKDGTMITLQPVQIMGMSDGTRVSGTGLVEKRDGTNIQLREGQIILVEGITISR
jgi:hypothetical protein